MRVTCLGAGAVSRALAGELARAGSDVVVWARSAASARDLANELGAVRAEADLATALGASELVLVAVRDDAIADLAARCARTHAAAPAIALHTNGFFGPEALGALAEAAWETGKLHPLVALPPSAAAGSLRGAWFVTAGTPRAREAARAVVDACDGRRLELAERPDASRAYHAAASLLSGGLVALFDTSLALVRGATEDEAEARDALFGLLGSTVANLAAVGPAAALTGPLARGATELVRGHLEALRAEDEEAGALYVALGMRMLALAEDRGSISSDERARLVEVLRGGV